MPQHNGGEKPRTQRSSPTSHRVTMKDVARRAGVSQPTVSFVLNNRRDVSVAETTRERVLRAAEELNFQHNRAAQSLRMGKSFRIGVLADELVASPYAGAVVLGIQKAVQSAGYTCVVVETSDAPDVGVLAANTLISQGVDGLIYASAGAHQVLYPVPESTVRTVFVNCWPAESADEPVVLADEYQGGRDIAAATFAAGHRDVLYLGGPIDDYATLQRSRGLDDAACEAGIDPDTIPREYGDHMAHSGYSLTLQRLATHVPTAIVCGNDRMALGALMALHELGLECPTDVSLVGFDDQPDFAAELRPPLTTIALPHLQMGLAGGKLLLDDDEPSGHVLIPCTYVPRESLGAPRQA